MSFAGKYERVSHENFDEFLTAVEVNDVWKKQALNSTPIMEVSEDNGVWTISTSSNDKSMVWSFVPGKEFEHTTMDGRELIIVVNKEGNKLISTQKQKFGGDRQTKIVREFDGDGVNVKMEIVGSDVACSQVFKRIE